jgi:hypothetical protein
MRKPDLSRFGLVVDGTDESWAAFNQARDRRYVLARNWDFERLPMLFAMCNSSNAGAADEIGPNDDPTIRKCIGFAKCRGRGGIVAVNASPVISKDPDYLLEVADICDRLNTAVLRWVFSHTFGDRVAAWGSWKPALHKRLMPGICVIKSLGSPLACYGKTKHGDPHHPSRIAYDTPLVTLEDGRIL